ncbi:MAG: GNAT family N-acetyltransferase [Steroidobacteraceae bacterium]
MTACEFREADLGDAASIASLHAESWRSAYRGMLRDEFLDGDIFADRSALWERRLRAPRADQLVLLALDRGSLIGFACVFGAADPTWGAHLDNLHVRPATKGLGIGTQLVGRAVTWLQEGFPGNGLFLWVYEANTGARGLYDKLGGEVREREISPAPGGGTIVRLRYVWPDLDALSRDITASRS